MANEYLKRTPTSTGNRRVFTLSLWFKYTNIGADAIWFLAANPSKDNTTQIFYSPNVGTIFFFDRAGSDPTTEQVGWAYNFRDCGSWYNMLIHVDTTKSNPSDRAKCFINGKELQRDESKSLVNNSVNTDTPPQNQEFWRLNYANNVHYIGARIDVNLDTLVDAIFSDYFFIDGQALTPDVFGKYDEGKGYISAGTTQATDFKKGQWIPKAPAIIKSVINARGGFGVNGFYLPMNSANNYGADFHTTPNSILKLKENLPQPKAEIDGAGDYTNALRDDPFKDYLVLAIPGVSGGLQSGFGDYSAAIKGYGSAKNVTASGNAGVIATSSYYGSALSFDGNGDYLRTSSNISDFQFGTGDFTIEAWIWKSANGVSNYDGLAALGTNGSASDGWLFEVSATLGYRFWSNSQSILGYNVSPNTSQWNHICVERYNGISTMYLNGVAVSVNTSSYSIPTTATTLDIGAYGLDGVGVDYWYNGYIQDFRIYKGVAKYKGGFDVPKPYTPINFANWRAVPDTCQNNFATLNSVEVIGSAGSGINKVLSNGNLTATTNGNSVVAARGNFPVSSGKWYFEATNESALGSPTQNDGIGVVAPGAAGVNGTTLGGYAIVYRDGGGAFLGNENSRSDPAAGTHATYVAGDIIGVALDIDNRDVEFFKNGVSVATYSFPSHIGTDDEWVIETMLRQADALIHHNFGQNPTFSGNTTAGTFTDSNGKGLFKYEPPSGFLALCEDNLPTPAIQNPGEHFKTVLYTGGGTSRNITGVGFKPDLVWIKERNSTSNHELYDIIRGPGIHLGSNTTSGNSTNVNAVRSFDNDGFSLGLAGAVNESSSFNYVAWCWKAGGPAVENTDGTITSQVSANQDAGFSIVSTNGSGTAGHGLNATPQFIISKRTTLTSDWSIQHHQMMTSSTGKLLFSSAGVVASSTPYMFNANDTTFEPIYTDPSINYCWTEIEGFSKFGSYVANNNADGPFVYCGFKPAWVMFKVASGGTGDWEIHDSSRAATNPSDKRLYADRNLIEDSGVGQLDFLSNGFKIRTTYNNLNASGATIIFAAFAESPFQTANAK
jgi:hypothetical protein